MRQTGGDVASIAVKRAIVGQNVLKSLKDSLKRAKERANWKRHSLNWDGGARAKGVWPPQTGTTKADPAQAKN